MAIPLKGNLFPDWNPLEQQKWAVKKRGHAAQPGSGPEGETCKTCRHRTRLVYNRSYPKCGLVPPKHSKTTDIRLTDPACELWEKKVASSKDSKNV